MWLCLAGMEWRKQKGRRCHKKHRREVACLANVTDCEFLLEETSYRRGDPCTERGNARSAACDENDLSVEELVPLSFDPDAEWPWSEDDAGDEGDDEDDAIEDGSDTDGDGVLRGDIYGR